MITLLTAYHDWVLNPNVGLNILQDMCKAFDVSPEGTKVQLVVRLSEAINRLAERITLNGESPWTPPSDLPVSHLPARRLFKDRST